MNDIIDPEDNRSAAVLQNLVADHLLEGYSVSTKWNSRGTIVLTIKKTRSSE